jgi:hypothetical protein
MIRTCQVEAEESRALRARLPPVLVSTAEGCQRVRNAIDEWQIPVSPEAAQDVVLAARELMASAVRVQPGGTTLLCMRIHAGRPRITVLGLSPCAVAVQDPQPGALDEDGCGLVVVAALADSWGWHPIPGGKAVYAVFETGGDREH